MTQALAVADVERFRAGIARRLGLQFDDGKTGLLGEVLRRRLQATGEVCERYLRSLESERSEAELGPLADELTVPETYFFRNIDQFHAFAEVAVPERTKRRRGCLRFLSAGCASGEEAYTLAMVLRDALEPGVEASVLAVDLSPASLGKARRGRYSTWSLREVPPEVEQKWFRREGREVVLDGSLKGVVRFEQRNLADEDPELWAAETYDAVFCRNVIMYFAPESGRALVDRITRSLVPGGYLFLGHAETLRGLSPDYHLCHTHRTFYYQRKTEPVTARREPPGAAPQFVAAIGGLVSLVDEADSWVGTIRRASERVEQLTAGRPGRGATETPRPGPPPGSRWDLGRALELLQAEHFADALDLVEALPSEASTDPAVLLLHAVLLTHAGLLDKAQGACRQLLEADGLNSGAHYVLALCREAMGDPVGAVDHDRMAAYLDPRFAMPRLHLALIARRARDLDEMRRELTQAIALLEGEDASRLLLFGGGFGREALIALCQAELAVGGEKS